MVNKQHSDEETTIETEETEAFEIEANEAELRSQDKIKQLQIKLKEVEVDAKQAREESARAKAEFLNARKRLEEDLVRNQERMLVKHVEKLLPLYDSFYLAMLDRAAWEQSPETWRRGVEAVFNQLTSILEGYDVVPFNPADEQFDPNLHEAIGNTPVTTEEEQHKIISVVQVGFKKTHDQRTTIIRPARVIVGEYTSQ